MVSVHRLSPSTARRQCAEAAQHPGESVQVRSNVELIATRAVNQAIPGVIWDFEIIVKRGKS